MIIRFAALLFLFAPFLALADERARALNTVIKGATKLEVTVNPSHVILYGLDNKGPIFTSQDAQEIDKLIQSLAFEIDSPGHCACTGDYRITFFKDDKLLTSVTFHHGVSLGWNGDHWNGDSHFTQASLRAWREWFKRNGEPVFHDAHEARLEAEKREARNRNAFLGVFPKESRKIIEDLDGKLEKYYLSHPQQEFFDYDDHPVMQASIKQLFNSIPDRQALASTITRSIGIRDHWMPVSPEVELVLSTSELLDPKDFQSALDSSDPITLLGLARLFFSWNLCDKFPPAQASPVAAKLIDFIAKHGHPQGGITLYSSLSRFEGPEITNLLERIALGKLKLTASPYEPTQELSFPHYACLRLSKTNSTRFQECLNNVSSLKTNLRDDPLALLIARANRNPSITLPGNIFESRSHSICFNALDLLEKQRSIKALDLIITKATTHDWAAVREEAVLTIERMTGKSWFKNGKNERAEWHGKDIREWWVANKDTFIIPMSKKD